MRASACSDEAVFGSKEMQGGPHAMGGTQRVVAWLVLGLYVGHHVVHGACQHHGCAVVEEEYEVLAHA